MLLQSTRVHRKGDTMQINRSDTAVVFIDPQNEVLSETGLAWPLVRESLQENNTIGSMERIFKVAKTRGFEIFISPHYFYPSDKGWQFNGPLETDEVTSGFFAKKGSLNLDGLKGSGADWLERFKPYIEDGKTIVVAPHKVWAQRPTISFCSYASGRSTKSFLAECWQTCALNLICAARARFRGSRRERRLQPQSIRNGATATRPRSLTMHSSHTLFCVLTTLQTQ